MYETIKEWLDTLELSLDQKVLANLALKLAADYDSTGNTSTAGELRKTLNELKRALNESKVEYDPLEDLLKR